jgi:hypothetical protein
MSWTGYHCSWYPLSISHDIKLELLLVGVFFLSKCLQPMKLLPSQNPSFEEQPSLIPTLKMLLHSRQLLKTVQAPSSNNLIGYKGFFLGMELI